VSRRVAWERHAGDDIQALAGRDRRQAARIVDAIDRYAEHDRGDVLKLTGSSGEYRLRVGDWRIVFRLEDGGRDMTIARVLNRRDAYR